MTENLHNKIQDVFDKVIYAAPPQLPQRVRGQVYDSLGMNVTEQLNTSLRGLVSEQSQRITELGEVLKNEIDRLEKLNIVSPNGSTIRKNHINFLQSLLSKFEVPNA